MNDQQILCEIARKEIEYGCYDAKIEGISLYTLIRRNVRREVQILHGYQEMSLKMRVNKMAGCLNFFVSCWHLLRIFLNQFRCETVFYAFPRVDKIQGLFMDKFTDAIIEQCDLKDVLILEHGRAGEHPKPRMHRNKIIYWDALHVYSEIYAKIFYKRFEKQHIGEFGALFESIEAAFDIKIDRNAILKRVLSTYLLIKGFMWILKKNGAKNVVGCARPISFFIAAHKLDIRVIELQHGITYGETNLYSGFRDLQIVPDFFLAFGENKPLDVYGIDESKIVNIGWALNDYISGLTFDNRYNEKDILVISDPEVTMEILKATLFLAEENLSSTFYIRPHPHEIITDEHRRMIEGQTNICIQDNRINITETLASFNYVIGENSTVMYEALSNGKRVGRLFNEGLHPKYLTEDDKECFWEIRTDKDFKEFLNGTNNKNSKSIYSPFDKQKFLNLLS